MSEHVRPMTNEEYIAAGGGRCPDCHDGVVIGGSLDVVGMEAWMTCHCLACKAAWTETYQLTGYRNLIAT